MSQAIRRAQIPRLERARASPSGELARVEGRRVVTNPFFLASLLAGLAIAFLLTRSELPVWGRLDVLLPVALFPCAAVTLFLANLASSRTQRDEVEDLYASLPAPHSSVRRSILLGLLAPTGAAAMFVVVIVAFVFAGGALGTPRVAELAVGPLVVLLCGAIGIVSGKWFPHEISAALSTAVVALAQVSIAFALTVSWARWLGPWVPASTAGDPAPELLIRPSAAHLLYLLSLIGLVGVLALVPRTNARGTAATAVLAVILVVTALLQASRATEGRTELVALVRDADVFRQCEDREAARYCVFDGYEPLIDHWDVPVRGVLSTAPALPDGPLRVTQTLDAAGSDLPVREQSRLANRRGVDSITGLPTLVTDTHWGAGEALGMSELGLALGTASWVTGLPPTASALSPAPDVNASVLELVPASARDAARKLLTSGGAEGCSSVGQGRSIVALWLAAGATDATEDLFREDVGSPPIQEGVFQEFDQAGPSIYLATGNVVAWGKSETRYAIQLLDRPRGEVVALLQDSWAELIDASTTTAEAAELMALEPAVDGDAPSVERSLRAGFVPCP
ncbi:MAG TPA: hypothetical protein VEU29_04770 [Actinomycetota bacterium]|nr:hypothetical protein [Actinomycetota bacterium]